MFIIEGPDGAGKTRLVEYLEQELGLTREPRAVTSEAQALVPLDDWITQELERGREPRLYDRFALISAACYSMLPNPTFSGKMWEYEWLRYTWWRLRFISPAVIVCLPPLEEVKKNVMTGDINLVVQNYIEEIYLRYHVFAAQDPIVTGVYDYTNQEPGLTTLTREDVKNLIRHKLVREKR